MDIATEAEINAMDSAVAQVVSLYRAIYDAGVREKIAGGDCELMGELGELRNAISGWMDAEPKTSDFTNAIKAKAERLISLIQARVRV